MMIEELVHIICSRKKGASKKEIFMTAKVFYMEIKPSMWRRLHYAISKGCCPGLYCEKKRWYSYESNYYKSLVDFVSSNEKGVSYMGMAMGVLPTWIDECRDIFKETFKPEDY